MKKQFIVLTCVSMLFAIAIASCSQAQGNLGDSMPSERSIGIVEPPDFPAEYRALLDECEELYNKMQEDPSYEAKFTEKKAELQKIKEKYGIESMTDEEMQADILKHSGSNNIVEPPDFPAEYRALLDECEELYNKMQEDPSYEAQLEEKRIELQRLEEKYGIESMSDEEMQEDILKHSGSNNISRDTTSPDGWLTSVYGNSDGDYVSKEVSV